MYQTYNLQELVSIATKMFVFVIFHENGETV